METFFLVLMIIAVVSFMGSTFLTVFHITLLKREKDDTFAKGLLFLVTGMLWGLASPFWQAQPIPPTAAHPLFLSFVRWFYMEGFVTFICAFFAYTRFSDVAYRTDKELPGNAIWVRNLLRFPSEWKT